MLDGFKYPPLESPKHREVLRRPISFRCLTKFLGIGQFARLLPSVEVVAVSQAPSPESNPNPPLPSTPWQSTTRPSLADRAVVRQKTLVRPAFARNELIQHFLVLLPLGIGLNFIHSPSIPTTVSGKPYTPHLTGDTTSTHVLAWHFAKVSNHAVNRNTFAADYV